MLQDCANATLYFVNRVFTPVCDAQPIRNRNIKQADPTRHSDRLDKVEA